MEPDWNAIRHENPSLGLRSVVPLGEGWTSRTCLIDGEVVLKFPKRSSDWEELDREIGFLAGAGPLLPLPVAQHLYQVRHSAGAPFGYAAYRHLPGQALVLSDATAALTSALARFLRTLHDMVPAPAIAPLLPHDDERMAAEQDFRNAQQRIGPALADGEWQRLARVFRDHLDDAGNFPVRPCVIHADLSAEHILCEGGRITGILDWGDVNLGDPDYDFSYLYADFGEAFVRDAAREYGHPDVDRLLRKARYFTVADQIGTIVHGVGRALDGQEVAAWRRLRTLLSGAD